MWGLPESYVMHRAASWLPVPFTISLLEGTGYTRKSPQTFMESRGRGLNDGSNYHYTVGLALVLICGHCRGNFHGELEVAAPARFICKSM